MESRKSAPSRARKLGRNFYRQPAAELAPALLGTILVHVIDGQTLRARIVETEAYCGPHDLASHSSRGRTRRTEVMFGDGGHAYVYFIYGMYEMFNVVASTVDDAQAVLVRAAEPMDGWDADLSGPGKLARAFKITRADNGLDLTGGKLYLTQSTSPLPRIVRTKRIGVDYAGEWKDELLRFIDGDSKAVSKSRG